MKKKIISMLLIAVLLISSISYVQAHEYPASEDKYNNEILDYVENWVFDNYSEHYVLSDFSGHIVNIETNGDQIKALVPIVVFTTLRYDSVESLPYMEGIKDRLNVSSLEKALEETEMSKHELSALSKANPDLSEGKINELSSMLSSQYADAAECIGVATEMALDFIVKARIENNGIVDIKLYVDEAGTLNDAEKYIPKSSEALKSDGKADIDSFISRDELKNSPSSDKGYAAYNRINARDYALQYSSNANKYCNCGKLYGVDYSCWNNAQYPYTSSLCHNDCADFVSQAMHAGGIPIEPGVWDRFNDGNSGYGLYGGWTWTSVSALKEYMTAKGYWGESTFAACNAGNILLTSESHITMVTLNDTVTHRYTAHTTDRHNYQFYYDSTYEYYTIKTA